LRIKCSSISIKDLVPQDNFYRQVERSIPEGGAAEDGGLSSFLALQTTRQHHPVITAEGEPFAGESMNRLIALACDCISELMKVQNQVLKSKLDALRLERRVCG
jgi:hypothetical protein